MRKIGSIVTAVAAAGVLLAACSSPNAASPSKTTIGSVNSSVSVSGYQTGNQAADAKAAIATARTVIDGGSGATIPQRTALIVDGDAFTPLVTSLDQKLPVFSTLTIRPTTVLFDPPQACVIRAGGSPCAMVVFDIYAGAGKAFASRNVEVVKTDGVWKITAPSYCALLQLAGAVCPPGTTSLPSTTTAK